jgi:hypothetical protein
LIRDSFILLCSLPMILSSSLLILALACLVAALVHSVDNVDISIDVSIYRLFTTFDNSFNHHDFANQWKEIIRTKIHHTCKSDCNHIFIQQKWNGLNVWWLNEKERMDW